MVDITRVQTKTYEMLQVYLRDYSDKYWYVKTINKDKDGYEAILVRR